MKTMLPWFGVALALMGAAPSGATANSRALVLALPGSGKPVKPLPLADRAPLESGALAVSIRPRTPVFAVGQPATFDVRIRNAGRTPVTLVCAVDGSDAGASPQVSIAITGPPRGFAVPGSGRCGNRNGISSADVFLVPPGEEFDPYANGWLGPYLSLGKFEAPGTYTATFRYSTLGEDPRSWMNAPWMGEGEWMDRTRDLMRKVPAVELVAETSFEVVP